ncbi:hypothetical protein L21SP2_0227 [Salinispira pacifica]|uniref:Uncharacterized protein n=1 Tax=Salinispira pacifica TaxID=1307761 RepID=V5WDM9_9SPIO|nr:hypothetical protein L21SP2_0227 [Salinispira pacifica]
MDKAGSECRPFFCPFPRRVLKGPQVLKGPRKKGRGSGVSRIGLPGRGQANPPYSVFPP